MATLILSYPGATFKPDGAPAEDVASAGARQEVRRVAYAAMGQWLELCDHLTRAGARILVLDPPRGEGQRAAVYAGRLGAEFLTPGTLNTPIFLRARGQDPAPGGPDSVGRAIAKAGLQVRLCTQRFQGELDVISIDRNRYILTYGSGAAASSRGSLDEVKQLLPLNAQTLEVELRPPYTAGRQGIAYVTTPGGSKVLLVHRGALLSHTPEDLAHFAGNKVEYFVLSPEDAAAHVTECVGVSGTLVMEFGSSTILRGQLARRGFQIVQTEVGQLFGPEKGGPRTLVCELPGLVIGDDAPSYAVRRDELLERRASYRMAAGV